MTRLRTLTLIRLARAGTTGRFTLIELLVVMVILVILMALLLTGVGQARQRARGAVCARQVRQIGLAVYVYVGDNNDFLPAASRLGPNTTFGVSSLRQLLTPHIDNPEASFHCPLDQPPDSIFASENTSYEWNTFISGKRIDRATTQVAGMVLTAPMLGDAEDFHQPHGRNYLYVDGHVSSSLEVLIE